MGVRASDVVQTKKSWAYLVSEFGNTVVSTNAEPVPQATTQVGNSELAQVVRQDKLDTTRIKLFTYGIYVALGAFVLLVLVLLCVVGIYLYLLLTYKADIIPSNFWHIPLLLAFMASTILSVILTLTARFGDKTTKHDNEGGIALSADQSTIKALLQKLIDKL